MQSYKILFLLIILLVASSICAQEPWSLEKCIKYALENNIQVKQQEIIIEQNKNNLTQSKFALLPSLNGNLSYSLSWGRNLDPSINQYVDAPKAEYSSVGLDLSLPVFNGLRKENIIKQNSINLKASIQDVERLKNDISLNVTAAYLQVLLVKENVAIIQQQLLATEAQVSQTKIMVDAGKLTLSNLLDLQAQQSSEEAQLVKNQNDLAIAFLTLKQLLELTNDNYFDIVTPNTFIIPDELNEINFQKIYDEAIQIMPEIKSSEFKLESAKKSIQIAQGAYYPSLNLRSSLSSNYSNSERMQSQTAFFEQLKEKRGLSVSAGLAIPIFNGLQTRTQVKNAKLNAKSVELELQRTKNTLYKTIQQAENDATGYFKSYQASLKNSKAIEEAFYYTQKKFDVGTVTSTDYIVAKNNLFKAQSDCIQAKYQFVFKMKILDFYKGLPITL